MTENNTQNHLKNCKQQQLKKRSINSRDNKGRTSLLSACEQGLNDLACELILKGADINARDNSGRTPLGIALEKGNSALAIALIGNGADFTALVHSNLITAQFFKSHPELITMLSANGVDANALSPQAVMLFSSDKDGTEALAAYIENGGNVNAVNAGGQSCLMLLAEAGNAQGLKLLIEHGANVNTVDKQGQTALMYAAQKGNTEAGKVLLENKAYVNHQDQKGETALMKACENGHLQFSKNLTEYNADITIQDNKGETALMKATKHGHIDNIKFLLEECCEDEKEETLTSTDKEQENKSEIRKPTAKAIINQQDNHGKTALMHALENQHNDVFKYLLQQKADVFVRDTQGKSVIDMIQESKNTYYQSLLETETKMHNNLNFRIGNMREQLGISKPTTATTTLSEINSSAFKGCERV